MSGYIYDDLLSNHVKLAVMGAAARGLLYAGKRALPAAAQFGLGYSFGVPIGKAGTAGAVTGTAKGIADTLAGPNKGPSILGFNLTKSSSHAPWETAAHVAPYLGFIGAHALEGHHPNVAHALNLGSLATLAGATGYDAWRHRSDRGPNLIDLGALVAMGGAELARMRSAEKTP